MDKQTGLLFGGAPKVLQNIKMGPGGSGQAGQGMQHRI